jgi:hypothetical protein
MNPINELDQPALLAIRKLVSEMHALKAFTDEERPTELSGRGRAQMRLFDISQLVARLMQIIRIVLGKECFVLEKKRVNDLSRMKELMQLYSVEQYIGSSGNRVGDFGGS